MSNEKMLELKSVKFFAQMSEETLCFHANVYWKGKKIGTIKNAGHGGECEDWADLDKREQWAEMEAWIDTLPERQVNFEGSKPFSYPESVDTLCNDLVTDFLYRRDFKKLCNKWVYFKDGDFTATYSIKKSPHYGVEQVRQHLSAKVDGECILINDLTFEQYRAYTDA